MNLNQEYLELPKSTIDSLRRTTNFVGVEGVLDERKFLDTFSTKIFVPELSHEKAVYVALGAPQHDLPPIHTLLPRG